MANGYSGWMRFVFALLCGVLLCGMGWGVGRAQKVTPQLVAPGQVASGQVQAGRTLSGVVTDADGALVPGAVVTLREGGATGLDELTPKRTSVTGADGTFSFGGVAVGEFRLTVSAEGLEGVTREGRLNEDESLEVPAIALGVAGTTTQVEVSSLTEEEIAETQMKAEEQQRLGGLIPNFYVTYDWKAAALTPKQKYRLAVRSIVDPATFVIVAGFAGIEQGSDEFSGYGQGWAGYGKRYGAGLADSSIGAMLGGAVLPVLFHQDPRYFYKGTGSVWARTKYALSTAVIARGDNGRWQPAYAGVLGDFASGAISNLYYPASDRNGAGLTLENGALSVAFTGVGNLLQEFLLKKLSTGAKSAGKPTP